MIPKPDPRAAFTLIELLVVITIIAILVALLASNLGSARERALSVKCASNLHQIGTGLLLFASEHDGRFPEAGAVIPHGSTPPGWTEQLEPYLGPDRKIYRCESCGRLHPKNANYSYFMGAHAAMLDAGGFAALRLTRINKPSRYILGGDISLDAFTLDDADKDDYTQDAAFGGEVAKLHGGSANILFADGSVRPYKKYNQDEMEISYSDPTATY